MEATKPFAGWPHAVSLSAIAFGLHFAWEILQCRVFFAHGSYDATMTAMVGATLGDVVITWMIYGGVALASRERNWSGMRWTPFQWMVMTTLALGMAILIEKRALATGAWSYTDLVPILPIVQVSAVPVLQLVLLTPFSFALARRTSARRYR